MHYFRFGESGIGFYALRLRIPAADRDQVENVLSELCSDYSIVSIDRLAGESEMNDVIYEHGGTIDKFIGDAIMVVFGAPSPMTAQDQTERASQCAVAMQGAMINLNKQWADDGIPELKMRIGIHHGPVVVGTFGSDKRSDYTAIGPTVNLASRIESVCEPGQVFISGEVCDYLDEAMVKDAGEFELKGVGEVNLYRLA